MAIGLVMAAGTAPASALYYPYGMNSQSFCVQNPSVNSTWLNAITNGRNSWNSHGSFPGNISVFSGCTSTLSVGSYPGTFLGHHSGQTAGTHYSILLDSPRLNAHINSNGYAFANVVKSTTAHEFGHTLRLNDLTSQSYLLMSHARNRNVLTGPATSEVNESNGYY
jgi:hypothetical protein